MLIGTVMTIELNFARILGLSLSLSSFTTDLIVKSELL